MDQIYCSIDNNPEACAQAVAALIRADQASQAGHQPRFSQQEFEEAAQKLAESMTDIHRAFGEAVLKAFSRNFRP